MKKRYWRKKLLLSKVQHDAECNKLKNLEFKSLDEKNRMLRNYCNEVLTKDIRKYIFISLDDDEYRFPSLERSIERGKKYHWIYDEFVETKDGIIPRWYLENKSICSQ